MKQSQAGGDKKSERAKTLLSQNDKSDPPKGFEKKICKLPDPVSTRSEIAKAAGLVSALAWEEIQSGEEERRKAARNDIGSK